MAVTSPKGTHDIIALEARSYSYIEQICEVIASSYGFVPIRTPIFESSDLFDRSVGESSDIVNKEMYTFLDKGNRSISLRPENTAGVVRSIITNKLHATMDLPLKFYYDGPMFRYERPQLGRYRQFHQFGVESIGVTTVYEDLEVIMLAYQILKDLGFEKITLRINSLGDQISRSNYRSALQSYFKDHIDNMCSDCQTRYKTNPLRILDCKVPADRKIAEKAPSIGEFLSESAAKDFALIQETLTNQGIEYIVDQKLVRGLDYYSGIIFEFHYITKEGKDYGALGGGGHYDRLVKELGGPELEGVGFAFGIERLHAVLRDEGLLNEEIIDFKNQVYVMSVGEQPRKIAFHFANTLRSIGIRTLFNTEDKPFKTLFKKAERSGAILAVIIGENEVSNNTFTIKNLATKEQIEISSEEVLDYIEQNIQDQENEIEEKVIQHLKSRN